MLHYYYFMVVAFVVGIILISLEDRIRINKAATAILMCVVMWLMLTSGSNYILVERANPEYTNFTTLHGADNPANKVYQISEYLVGNRFVHHLGTVAETLFFVMGTMLIVNIVDKHGGFKLITDRVNTRNKRKLLWIIAFLSFFLSAMLDNLAAALVLIAILRKMVPDKTDRMKYACMIILSANAGGSWSPIGDVTTLLLWTGGYLTPGHQVTHVFLPALINLLLPLTVAHFWLFKKGAVLRQEKERKEDLALQYISHRDRLIIFTLGILSLALVPAFQYFTGLPPFLCVMVGLTCLWMYTDVMHGEASNKFEEELRVTRLFKKVDLATIFFFLGILMSVAALETGGQLHHAAQILDEKLHMPFLLSSIIGIVSSFTDNVALVAGTMGMYPITTNTAALTEYTQNFVHNGPFWTAIAYAAVTGGSLLIIGSATGVTVMGLEKISFAYYFKRFSGLALLGYIGGLCCSYFIEML